MSELHRGKDMGKSLMNCRFIGKEQQVDCNYRLVRITSHYRISTKSKFSQ